MKNIFRIFLIIILNVISEFSQAQMYWNQACSFAGSSSSYISVPNSSTLNITSSFTIEAWINPSTLFGASKGIVSKGGALGTSLRYAVRLNTTGTISLLTGGSARLTSSTSNPVPVNKWTHISCTYKSSTNTFAIYINGLLDTSAVVAGAAPPSNTDSLFIGISGASTPFNGQLDEIRLWNRTLAASEIIKYYRSTIGTSSGPYNGLIMSMTFQDRSSISPFTTKDVTNTGNNGNTRIVTPISYIYQPYTTIHNNESVYLDGNNSYLSAKDTTTLSAAGGITMECWIYQTSNAACSYISKGNSYSLSWNGARVTARINGVNLTLGTIVVPLNKWTHLSLRYSNDGTYNCFLNGVPQFGGFEALGNINLSSDSLYIGGGPGALAELTGFIDEVRIARDYSKNNLEILEGVNESIDEFNDLTTTFKHLCYNLDGTLYDNCNNGGPALNLRGGAMFSHPSYTGFPVSPMTRHESNKFSSGFFIGRNVKSIPLTGSIGNTFDTISINENLVISDVNLFIALNHDITSQLDITLYSPSGDSIKVFDNFAVNQFDKGMNIIYDDQSDSSLANLRFTTFSPQIKPANSLNSALINEISQGKWILKINDNNAGETGTLYAWGLQFNNQTVARANLNLTCFIQGMYNPVSNSMVKDTMEIIVREFISPYGRLDSSTAVINENGLGLFTMKPTLLGVLTYIQLKHRNSIETWNSGFIKLSSFNKDYDFSTSEVFAFGNNEINVDQSPVRYAIYNGDINQDDVVDLTDVTAVFNDGNAFVSGYVNTDVTGDNFVDLSDLSLTFNNSNNFVSAVLP